MKWLNGAIRPAMLIAALVLAGCSAGPQAPETAPAVPGSWPPLDYESIAAQAAVYRLDADRSRVEIVVRRDGPLARLGHDHVIVVRDLEGYLSWDANDPVGYADLRFPAASLEVDAPEARAAHGLDTEPDERAVQSTQANLQNHVLDSAEWPWIELKLQEIQQGDGHARAKAMVTLRGEANELDWSFHLQRSGDRVLVEGRRDVRQTDLGLVPFSVLGGGLRVANTLEIHYRLEGVRMRIP